MSKENKIPKVIVLGHAQHGKDTVCEYLRDKYDISFQSSSLAAATHVVYPALKDKYGYKDLNECYADRVNHREEWFNLIAEYTKENKTKLADEIFKHSDVYCGIRRHEELAAITEKYKCLLLYIDASKRKPSEAEDSFTVDLLALYNKGNSAVTLFIYNNDTKEKLYEQVDKIVPNIKNHLNKAI